MGQQGLWSGHYVGNNKLMITFFLNPDFSGFLIYVIDGVLSVFWPSCKFIRIYSTAHDSFKVQIKFESVNKNVELLQKNISYLQKELNSKNAGNPVCFDRIIK